jgi:hypothetical protein
MLRDTKELEHYAIKATDGEIGQVNDFYFDDDGWVIRYLVVETGGWLSSRRVLISPVSVHHPDWVRRTLEVSITREQVKNSPDIDTERPVTRQNEAQYMGYYGYTNYWGGAGMWGGGIYPYGMVPGYAGYDMDPVERDLELQAYQRVEKARHQNDDPHLRSCNAVHGYHIEASDGGIGHVAGYLVDERTWAIRYLVVDTSNWWMGHKVLIAPDWISGVHWADKTVSIDLSRASVKAAPVYDPIARWSPQLDSSLYQHYGRADYWSSAPYYPTSL